jgi:hypothetical protein
MGIELPVWLGLVVPRRTQTGVILPEVSAMLRHSAPLIALLVLVGSVPAQEPKALEGEYLIESALKPGMVLDATDAKSDDFTLIQLAGPGDQKNRRWRLIRVGEGEYLIETALKTKVFLDVQDARAENGAAIQLGGNTDEGKDQPNRRWRLLRVDVK